MIKETRNTQQLQVNDRHVVGYAIVFDSVSTDLGGFTETIDRHALDGILEKSDVLCLLDHNVERGVLARFNKGQGSLTLTIDDIGLKYEFDAPCTALGDEVLEGIRRGDINSSSFAFTCEKDEWYKLDDGSIRRHILKIGTLTDVSCVYHPAYEATSVVIDRSGYDRFVEAEKRNNELKQHNVMKRNKRSAADILKDMQELVEEMEAVAQAEAEEPQEEEKESVDEPVNEDEDKEQCSDEKNEDEQPEEEKEVADQTEETEEKNDEAEDEADKEVEAEAEEDKEENRNNININSRNMNKMNKSFSLIKAINDVVNNRSFDEATQTIVNEGRSAMKKSSLSTNGQIVLPVEHRDDPVVTPAAPTGILAKTAGHGAENVAVDKLNIVEPLRANMVLAKAGATYLTGLVGSVSIPVYSASNVGWAGETAQAVDGAGQWSDISLTPKRLTAFIDISKMFLAQDSNDAEEMLKRDIINAIAEKLEQTIFGAEAGTDKKPAGLFNDVAANTTVTKFDDICAIEESLENANVNDFVYVVNPSAKAILRKVSKDSGSAEFVLSNGEIEGRNVYVSSAVTPKGIVCGDFKDYVVAQWGGLDLTIDPYSRASENLVRIVINGFFDAAPRRPEAFVAKILK